MRGPIPVPRTLWGQHSPGGTPRAFEGSQLDELGAEAVVRLAQVCVKVTGGHDELQVSPRAACAAGRQAGIGAEAFEQREEAAPVLAPALPVRLQRRDYLQQASRTVGVTLLRRTKRRPLEAGIPSGRGGDAHTDLALAPRTSGHVGRAPARLQSS